MAVTIRIIRPSSREKSDLLAPRLAELRTAGFDVRYRDLPEDPHWRISAASVQDRCDALVEGLCDPETHVVWAARGGYGASDLLSSLPWKKLAQSKPKLLVGFSDISALHSALYTQLGWFGLHGPMPATALWRKDPSHQDVDQLLNMVRTLHGAGTNAAVSGRFDLRQISGPSRSIAGRLFGGCFSVLSSLIGTPYFPKSLAGHVIFLEDTDENPGRLMRGLNQWLLSGALNGVEALVLGHLRGLGENTPDSAPFVLEQFGQRLPGIAVFHTPLFGHTSPNHPLMVGAPCTIEDATLTWTHRVQNEVIA